MKRLATIIGGVLAVLLTTYLLGVSWSSVAVLADPVRLGIVVGGLVGAIFAGEFARLIRLPRLVGYLAVGVILGPFAARFAERTALTFPPVVTIFSDLGALFTGAAALVGIAIGLRVRGSAIFGAAKSIAAFAAVPTLFIVAACGSALFVADLRFDMLHLEAFETYPYFAAALVGLLVATSSPSAVWGTNAEFHVEASFAESQLQVTVIANAVIAFALAGLVGAHIFDVAGDAAYGDWLADLGVRLATALAAGLAAGFVLLAALRWLQTEIVPLVVVIAVVAALVASDFPGFVFIGGIVAGAVVASLSSFSHAISESLDRGAPVTLAIVFLYVGLLLDLPVTRSSWLLAAALVVARIVASLLGSPIAVRIAELPDVTERLIPTATLAQGFAPLLLTFFVIDSLPDAGGLLYILTPVILIDAIIGPVIQRRALVRLGHHRPARLEVDAPRKRRGRVRRALLDDARSGGLDAAESLLPPVDLSIPSFACKPLTQVAERVRARLERTMDRVAAGYFDSARGDIDDVLDIVRRTLRRHVRDTIACLKRQHDPERRLELLRQRRTDLDRTFLDLFRSYGATDSEGLSDALDTIFRDLQRIGDLPASLQAPELEHLWAVEPGDDRWRRFRKLVHRTSNRIGPPPARSVPVRTVGTQVLVHGIVARLEPAMNMVGHKRLYLWHKVEVAWSELDAMYARSLDYIDADKPSGRSDEPVVDEAAELDEFDRRLAEGEAARKLSAEVATDGTIDSLLHSDETEPPDDAIAAYWRGKLEELSFEHEQLEHDVHTFEADTRRRMALAFSDAFQDFVWALERAGTFLLPTRALEPRGVTYHLDAEERAHHAARHWRALVNSHLDRRAMRLQLRIVQAELHPMLDDAVEELSRELASHLTYYPAEICERCEEVVTGLAESIEADASTVDLLDAVVQLRTSMNQFLQDDALQDLQEVRQTQRFSEIIGDFVYRLESLIARQPDVFSLPSEDLLALGETESARHVQHLAIPFREILERNFVANVSASLNELELEIRAITDRVASGLGEINRVVSFNLDAAAGELRSANDDDPVRANELVTEFALGGIRRAGQAAAELLDGIQHDIERVERELVERCVAHLADTRDLLMQDNASNLVSRALQTLSPNVPNRGREALDRARDTAKKVGGKLIEPVTRAVQSAEERLALHDGDEADLKAAAAVAQFDHERFDDLPNAYRRLFAPVPVEIPEIFVERAEARSTIKRALRHWRAGHPTAIAVNAHAGIGATSFVHRILAEELADVQMVRWNLRDRLTSSEDFVEQLASLFGVRHAHGPEHFANALDDATNPRLVLIDGLENLYLRATGRAGALSALLEVITGSPANILWIATCNPALFRHLRGRIRVDDVFGESVELPPFDREELEDLVMRRHQVSGYTLHFVGPDDAPDDASVFKDSMQRKRRRQFFDRLNGISHGSPTLALYHWLDAIVFDAENDRILAQVPHGLAAGAIRRLDLDRLIGLSHVVLHEQLSEREFAELERCSLDEARKRLNLFLNLGVVTHSNVRRDTFVISAVLQHHVRNALSERNVLA